MAERITGHTELIGLYGLHESDIRAHRHVTTCYLLTLDLNYAYLAFEVDNNNLREAVKEFRANKACRL